MADLHPHDKALRLLIESISDYAIYMLDREGRVVTWNRGAQRMTGFAAREAIGRHFGMFYTLEARQAGAPLQALRAAMAEGRFEDEGWRVRKDGSPFWASTAITPVHDEAGDHIGYAKITRDISERRAAEETLLQSERQFRMLVSSVVDYALFMLDPNGIITNWNPGAEKIKGYAASEIIGQHFSRFYTETDRAAGLPMKALQTAGAAGRFESEGWRVRKDGSLFWASVVLDAIRDEAGRILGFAKITRDITEKREAQLELQRAHEQLAQAQKMEALGQLTGGVAHDFNNLLMVVSGQAQLLRRKLRDDPAVLKAVDSIEVAARRGADLTRHLLSFARRQRLQPVSAALADQAAGLRQLLSAGLPDHIELIFNLPPVLWPVEVDMSELELALLNLTVNARDAMPAGGVLTIAGENIALTATAEPRDLEGEFVALKVADTGVGIPPDILPRIFDPFFSTKDVNRGTGLGLSQVYGFAQQSGGRLTVASELGRGTTFTIYLPRAGAAPSRAAATRDAPTGASVLLVEDNPEVAAVAAGILEQLGHRVRLATDAGAALQAVQAEAPDVVFSDIVMAGELDGLALARRLREELPELPVLLATGYSQAAERIGREFPILRKPYTMADLSEGISAVLAKAREDAHLVRIDDVRRTRSLRAD